MGAVADLCLGKMLDQKKNRGEPMPYLANVNVRWGEFVLDDLRTMRFEPNELERYGLKFGDIVMCEGGEPGRCAVWKDQIPHMMIQKALHRIRPKALLDYRFLFYNLLHIGQKNGFDRYFTGSTIKHLPGEKLAKVEVVVPPLATQRRIASILSAYDDLIENNTRRIAILEEMARRIYEEWFVRFRFPGHEQVKMVESELGSIPEGWRREPLGALLEHHIGGGWGQEEESAEFPVAAYVIRGTDIPDIRLAALGRSPLRFHKESNFRTRKLQPGDIIFEVSGGSKDQPVGRSVLLSSQILSAADQPIICASFCRLVRANEKAILPELLQQHFERIYDNREIMKYQTQSTGITNFKFTVFLEKELVLVAPEALQEKFRDSVKPLYDLAAVLGVKNTNLRATRDLLLPRLISGELDVSTFPEPEEAIAA